VREFKKNFPKEGLWWTYKGKTEFKLLLRGQLEAYLRKEFTLVVTRPPKEPNTPESPGGEDPFDTRLSQIRRAFLQASSLQELEDCLLKVRSLAEQFRDHPRVHEARALQHQIENAIEKERARELGIRPQPGQRVHRWMKTTAARPLFAILIAVVGVITYIASFTDSVQKLANLFKKAPPPVVVTGTPVRIGKPTGNAGMFSVDQHFWATGDIGDVQIASGPDLDRFTYTTNGLGPHEFEWKYVNGGLNPEPAQFAGVMYLNPPNNFGTDPTGGFDLRGYRVVRWRAHSLTGNVNVDFSMGGVTWIWDDKARVQVTPPFPESLSIKRLGTKTLDTNWQEFEAAFAPEDNLRCVINGFAWTISWSSNDVNLNETRTGPVNARTFQVEVRDIRYER